MRSRGVNLLPFFKMFTLFASSFLDFKIRKTWHMAKRSSSFKKQTSSIFFFFFFFFRKISPFPPPKTFAPLLTHRKSRPVSQFAQSTLTSPILILMRFVHFPLKFHQGSSSFVHAKFRCDLFLSSYPFESKTTPSKSSFLF